MLTCELKAKQHYLRGSRNLGGNEYRYEFMREALVTRDLHFGTDYYENFRPEHFELFQRTWSDFVRSGEVQPLAADQLKRCYEENPSGVSILAVARADSRWVGAVSAIPTKLRASGGALHTAYQIGDFMVDPDWQRKGVGTRMLAALTEALLGQSKLVYTFPNPRSIGVFFRHHYEELRHVAGRIMVPLVESCRACSSESCEQVSLTQAMEIADTLTQQEQHLLTILKNGDYFQWRYGKMRDSNRYDYWACQSDDGGCDGLLVSMVHRFRGMRFSVLLDALGSEGRNARSMVAAWCAKNRFPLSALRPLIRGIQAAVVV